MRKTIGRIIKDLCFLPIRILFSHERVESFGLTSIRQERIKICHRYARGFVLDVGSGYGNRFIKEYRNGVGVDVYPWKGTDVCCDAVRLPFLDKSFDTVTFSASLHYTSDRLVSLSEACRVLKNGGSVLILTNNPLIYYIRHKLAWWDRYSGEKILGFWPREMKSLLSQTGFKFEKGASFIYGISKLYIGRKP